MLEFIRTVNQLRKAHKKYKKRKTKANLEQIIKLETKTDEMLEKFKIEQLEIFKEK